MGSRFREIALLIEQATAIEHNWRTRGQFRDGVHIPFIPVPIPQRIAMMAEALPLIGQDESDAPPGYLEPGCGPGTGLDIAAGLFGMDAHGFELNEAMASDALERGLSVQIADADDWAGYEKYPFVWYNAVFRDPDQEEFLEQRIWRETAPGTVVACINTRTPPPSDWIIILDAWEERHGIWMKPPASADAGN